MQRAAAPRQYVRIPPTQVARRLVKGAIRTLVLPGAAAEILPGIRWGAFDRILTPAFWKVQCWLDTESAPASYRVGDSLHEEAVACLLGGYGIPSEVGYAAYFALFDAGLVVPGAAQEAIYSVLSGQILVRGKAVKYRFPKLKARYVAGVLRAFVDQVPALSARDLRNWLELLPGVGQKTAAWIVRNVHPEAELAIIDVHVFRACSAIGLFDSSNRIARDYGHLEDRYLALCRSLGVRPAHLDAIMWRTMKELGAYGQETAALMVATRVA